MTVQCSSRMTLVHKVDTSCLKKVLAYVETIGKIKVSLDSGNLRDSDKPLHCHHKPFTSFSSELVKEVK